MNNRHAASLLGASLLVALTSTKADAEIRVVTSIKPLQLIAAEIQDGVGEPEVLVPAGSSAHSFSLKPSTVRDIQAADIVYWIGPDLEGYLSKSLTTRSGKTVAIQNLPGLHIRHFGEEHEHAEHGHEEPMEHSPAGDDHDDQHRPGSVDAHLWLRPNNALVIAKQMATDLSAADPQNAARYQANVEAFSERLSKQDQQLKARLTPLATKSFFVFHQTFDYFEEAYGLSHTGVLAIGGEVRPGARHVAEMRAKLEAAGPSCLFSEPPVRPKLSDTLASGLPVRFAELDALGYGVAVKAGGYTELMSRVGDELAKCLESLDKPKS
ncbi:zinc ABC transporter substrate-binding protein [Pseudomonas sichuanensis]|uniref:zinc ABC transporter substrate-binding protein n=1 Tax=Pseudomonas sichuanensis TaxID=2213015 RepID=UPI00244CB1AB|nr:zinc ABC transporter substrate-binding protein [Pseudomonas sichuanensis]MDH0731457.1 zinc ABC transporter substrate-binding protein [Pseudomonas sichuanensis]MDH1584015.1 zinc ABC transporter substrate-binding protein [Pseudomonas sichuanensis]MDH1591884.1 zinc ABC transporter substrate-binding protein [Pseudomonas sichuanensis]MDH1597342.1 zinc ABC transporter substrate-binding protein [Pseudomonas sichuanensis]